MVKWVMEDDILEPTEKLVLEYKGENPFKFVKSIKDIVTSVLQIGSSKYWERDFRWSSVSDPAKFYVKIFAKRGLDAWSHILVEIVFQGSQPLTKGKTGNVRIEISGKLVTKYEFKTAFQKTGLYKSLIFIYNKAFYWEIRRRYLRMGKGLLYQIYDKLKEMM